ncbi:acyltransferase family protein [Streptococcus suis]
MKHRLFYLDIFKVIGLLCIVLAHVFPPQIIFQARNFDVILMIVISSMLFFYSNRQISFWSYVGKRFERLVIPTWIFLAIFFSLSILLFPNYLSLKLVATSFALEGGIGYVWVIRIYFIIACLLPFIKWLCSTFKKSFIYIGTLFLYVFYEVLCHFNVFNGTLTQYLFAYWIPCLVIGVVSYWMIQAESKMLFYFSILNLSVFFLICYIYYLQTGQFVNSNIMKYPFRLYYLSYGFSITGFLYLSRKFLEYFLKKIEPQIMFISSNSLWIYLFHIPFVIYLSKYYSSLNWGVKFLLALFSSILIVLIKNLIITYIGKFNKTKLLEYFKG